MATDIKKRHLITRQSVIARHAKPRKVAPLILKHIGAAEARTVTSKAIKCTLLGIADYHRPEITAFPGPGHRAGPEALRLGSGGGLSGRRLRAPH